MPHHLVSSSYQDWWSQINHCKDRLYSNVNDCSRLFLLECEAYSQCAETGLPTCIGVFYPNGTIINGKCRKNNIRTYS